MKIESVEVNKTSYHNSSLLQIRLPGDTEYTYSLSVAINTDIAKHIKKLIDADQKENVRGKHA